MVRKGVKFFAFGGKAFGFGGGLFGRFGDDDDFFSGEGEAEVAFGVFFVIGGGGVV